MTAQRASTLPWLDNKPLPGISAMDVILGALLGACIGALSVLMPGLQASLILTLSTGILVNLSSGFTVGFCVACSFTATALEVIPASFTTLTFELQAGVTGLSNLAKRGLSLQGIGLHLDVWWASVVGGTIVALPTAMLLGALKVKLSLGTLSGVVLIGFLVLYLATNPSIFKNLLYIIAVGGWAWYVMGTDNWDLANASSPVLALITGLLVTPVLIISLITGKPPIAMTRLQAKEVKLKGLGPTNGILAGLLSAVLPALPSSAAAVLFPTGEQSDVDSIILSAETSGWNNSIGLWLPLFAVTGAHSGSSGEVLKYIQQPTIAGLIIILFSLGVAWLVSTMSYEVLARMYVGVVSRVDPRYIAVVAFIPVIATALLSGNTAFYCLVLATTTMLGLVAVVFKVERSSVIAFMAIPFILATFGV
jgi:TctA family transporter